MVFDGFCILPPSKSHPTSTPRQVRATLPELLWLALLVAILHRLWGAGFSSDGKTGRFFKWVFYGFLFRDWSNRSNPNWTYPASICLKWWFHLGDFGFRGHIWHEATRNNDKVDFSRHLASCKMFMLDVLLVCCKKTTCELYKRMSPSCLKYVIFPQICSVLHSQWLFHWGIFQPETLGKAQMIYTTITGK